MRALIIQPKLEHALSQLELELRQNTVDIVILPEGYLNENLEQACRLAKQYNTVLIGGYRKMNERPKDRAVIINRAGEIVLDRVKYSDTACAQVEEITVGHILCDELIIQGIKNEKDMTIDVIVHPIGVGMFSEAQFQEWIESAQKIAAKHQAMIIGTSHADGTFRDSNISIPIAYCFNNRGETIFIAKNDTRPRILNISSGKIQIIN